MIMSSRPPVATRPSAWAPAPDPDVPARSRGTCKGPGPPQSAPSYRSSRCGSSPGRRRARPGRSAHSPGARSARPRPRWHRPDQLAGHRALAGQPQPPGLVPRAGQQRVQQSVIHQLPQRHRAGSGPPAGPPPAGTLSPSPVIADVTPLSPVGAYDPAFPLLTDFTIVLPQVTGCPHPPYHYPELLLDTPRVIPRCLHATGEAQSWRGVSVDGITLAMSVPSGDRGWQRTCRARLMVVTVPFCGGTRDSGCGPGGAGACCNTSGLLARAARRGDAGFMTHTGDRGREGSAGVLVCLDIDAVAADLAAGKLACPSCGSGRLPGGVMAGRAVRLRGGPHSRVRPGRARCRSCRRTHILLPPWCAPRRRTGSRSSAPRRAWRWPGLAMAGHGHRAVSAVLGVPAGTVRGRLRRLRARAGRAAARDPRAVPAGLLPAGAAVRARGVTARAMR